MARTVDALEAEGLIVRSPHPTDRRQNMITLTDSGRAVIARDRRAREAWPARAMAAVLSPEERVLLARAGEPTSAMITRIFGRASRAPTR